jgi:hypothetical protein
MIIKNGESLGFEHWVNPFHVTGLEQRGIEAHAPEYSRNIVRIFTETGL